jgi:hypothetical protein
VSAIIVSDWSGAKGGGGVTKRLKLRVIRGSGADILLRKELRMSKFESLGINREVDEGRRRVLIDIVKSSGSEAGVLNSKRQRT